ncbi:hypothetical protein IG631_13158 [Alternaria alternata]|nr:hypothetical protein IG631_13158 [Alternaria alternata]
MCAIAFEGTAPSSLCSAHHQPPARVHQLSRINISQRTVLKASFTPLKCDAHMCLGLGDTWIRERCKTKTAGQGNALDASSGRRCH